MSELFWFVYILELLLVVSMAFCVGGKVHYSLSAAVFSIMLVMLEHM